MPFFQIVDELTGNPKFQRLFNEALTGSFEGPAAAALWMAAGTKVQQALTDGIVTLPMCVSVFLNKDMVLQLAARLVEVGLWHEPGHSCERCADPPQGAWVFHDWFDLRYSTGEAVKATRGKRTELKDRKVTNAVWARDRIGPVKKGGDMDAPCRYCGVVVHKKSRGMWQYDHVNPTLYVGAENIVIACTDCNKQKQARTPEEAGMTLHRPGWRPGEVDWPHPPVLSVPAAHASESAVSSVEERPAGPTGPGPVDASTPMPTSPGLFDAYLPRLSSASQVNGGGETTSVEERPAGPTGPGPVDASTPGVDSPHMMSGAGGGRSMGNMGSGWGETASVEERPAGPTGPGPVDASTLGVDSPAASTPPFGTPSDLQRDVRQVCGTSAAAAAAVKRVSTRARAGQGRAGQGQALKGKEGTRLGQDGTPQGGAPASGVSKKRRRRKKKPVGPGHAGGVPAGMGEVVLAGAVPDVALGGGFGSPWANWHGRPPEEDDAVCPEHGDHVPCRLCLEGIEE